MAKKAFLYYSGLHMCMCWTAALPSLLSSGRPGYILGLLLLEVTSPAWEFIVQSPSFLTAFAPGSLCSSEVSQ